jgi:replicative DNA helicase
MRIVRGKTLTSEEFASKFTDMQYERHKNPEKYRGLSFFHPDLDRITGGVRRGEYIVVAGAQKTGKTMAALAWTLNFAKQLQNTDETVLMVSLEMSHRAIGGRVFANLSGIDSSKFRDYKLEDQDWPVMLQAGEDLKALPILWNVGAYHFEAISELVAENNVRVVVVDYFQLMMGDPKFSRRHEALEDLSLHLKQLATRMDISVVATAQQTRESLKSISAQRSPNTMAGTQALARDADMMLIILPLMKDGEEVPHYREIWVALSRNSAAEIGVETLFVPHLARMGAPAPEDVYDELPTVEESQIAFWEGYYDL